MQAV
jgi:putative SOS response-associated peptidase YedK